MDSSTRLSLVFGTRTGVFGIRVKGSSPDLQISTARVGRGRVAPPRAELQPGLKAGASRDPGQRASHGGRAEAAHRAAAGRLPGILRAGARHRLAAAVHARGRGAALLGGTDAAALPPHLVPLPRISGKPPPAGSECGTADSPRSRIPQLEPRGGARDFCGDPAGETAGTPRMGTEGVGVRRWRGLPEAGGLSVRLAHRGAPRLAGGTRRLGERGAGRGTPGGAVSPGRPHATGTQSDPAAPAPWGLRFGNTGTFGVNSGSPLSAESG